MKLLSFLFCIVSLSASAQSINNATVNISPDGTAINGSSTNIVSFYDLSPFAANTHYDFNWIMNTEL
jgi:hypothetical protein